jgi:hypothetical protein
MLLLIHTHSACAGFGDKESISASLDDFAGGDSISQDNNVEQSRKPFIGDIDGIEFEGNIDGIEGGACVGGTCSESGNPCGDDSECASPPPPSAAAAAAEAEAEGEEEEEKEEEEDEEEEEEEKEEDEEEEEEEEEDKAEDTDEEEGTPPGSDSEAENSSPRQIKYQIQEDA